MIWYKTYGKLKKKKKKKHACARDPLIFRIRGTTPPLPGSGLAMGVLVIVCPGIRDGPIVTWEP